MAESMSIGFDASSAYAGLDALQEASEAALRPAAQAGAEDLYFETRLRCPESDHAHYFYGRDSKKTGVKYYFAPGNLRNSLYQVFSKDNSGKTRATYHVAWNHTKAPYGFMVEYGTSYAPAHPFLRPAFDSRAPESLQIVRNVYVERMNEAIKALAS
ncbi:MAG: HK97-gp10 family putative phage morphogenesis protein [Pseudomonadota bacterium]